MPFRVECCFFQTFLGIQALAKNVILEVYFVDRK